MQKMNPPKVVRGSPDLESSIEIVAKNDMLGKIRKTFRDKVRRDIQVSR